MGIRAIELRHQLAAELLARRIEELELEQLAQAVRFGPERCCRIVSAIVFRLEKRQLEDGLVQEVVGDGVAVIAGHRVTRRLDAVDDRAALAVADQDPAARQRVELPEERCGVVGCQLVAQAYFPGAGPVGQHPDERHEFRSRRGARGHAQQHQADHASHGQRRGSIGLHRRHEGNLRDGQPIVRSRRLPHDHGLAEVDPDLPIGRRTPRAYPSSHSKDSGFLARPACSAT